MIVKGGNMCTTCSSLLLDKLHPTLPLSASALCPCLVPEACTIGCVLDLLPVSIPFYCPGNTVLKRFNALENAIQSESVKGLLIFNVRFR
ncbi:hypothetical protein ElyMa_005747100 [Elysia marginata]|uniref:Uncharacterized protein n=1 Tax=Elysia marginata TaxID=1093978 RepID=A0AAV4FMG2_9GAST|nr:hypothetical protein ElyMa_005747100 [Elysia marginata]